MSLRPLTIVLLASLLLVAAPPADAGDPAAPGGWEVGEPIVTYYAGPDMNEAVARQMADVGMNVVWCGERDLDLLQKQNLRGMLRDALLTPATLDDAAKVAQLDALIER